MWGIKINKFIDATKSKTKWINRFINTSSFIYEEEKYMTLVEINKTVDLNRVPMGSKMIIKLIWEDWMVITSHSIINVLLMKLIHSLKGKTIMNNSVRSREALSDDGKNDMVKDRSLYFWNHNLGF